MRQMPTQRKGWLELGERISAALLSSPRFKARLHNVLEGIDPAGAVGLVKALLWTDPEVPLGLLGVAPRLVNAGILGVGAAVSELSFLSRDMVKGVMDGLRDEVLVEELEQTYALCLERFFGLTPSEAGFKMAAAALALLLGALERELERDPAAGERLQELLEAHPLVKERLTR